MKKHLLIALIGLIGFSCASPEEATQTEDLKAQADSLLKEVMYVHDEIMPKTLELENFKKKIKTKIQESDLDSIAKDNMMQVINDIDTAVAGMRIWMSDFEIPADSLSKEKVIDYFNEQIEILKEVEKNTFDVLPKAEEFAKTETDSINAE